MLVCQDGPLLPGPLRAAIDACLRADGWRRVVHEGPRGLHHNLNFAARRARAPWIARMDADDICLPDRFARQARFLADNPEVDVLGGAICEFAPDGSERRRSVPLEHAQILRRARWRNPMNHMTVVMRLDRFLSVGGYPAVPRKEDYALWLRLIGAGARFANLPQDLVRARLGVGFARRRAGLSNIGSEWALTRLKAGLPGVGGPLALSAFALRAGALAFETPAGLLYRRVLR